MSNKQPKALYWLTAAYTLFMASFGCIVSSLVVYEISALQLSSDKAYSIFAAAMALIWILPLGGGYTSTKLGYMNAVRVGIIFCILGFVALAIPTVQALYLGLALFIVGNAYATPATFCLVDHCYAKDSPLRESGFTLFYLYFNLGALVGIFFGGYIAKAWGFSVEFLLAAAFLVASLVLFHFSKHKIGAHKDRSIVPQVRWAKKKIALVLIVLGIVATPICMLLFENITISNSIMLALLVIMVFVLFKIAFKQKEKLARTKMIAFICLSTISIVFWVLYSLEPSFLSVFVKNNVNRDFLGISIPASSFFAFDSVFVIIIGFAMSKLWEELNRKKINPPLSAKFASALVLIGLGFCFLSLMTHLMGARPMPSYYVVLAYVAFATGELLVSPLGISMVGRLAPEGHEGIMMGFWQLCSGIGGLVAGYVGVFSHLPTQATSIAKTNPIYAKVFLIVGGIAIVMGFILFFFVKKLRKLMKGHSFHKHEL